MTKSYLFIKRLIDIAAASVSLMLLAPLMLVVGLIIKLASPGPLFFRQRRVGLNGKEFDVLKFRTMMVNAEQSVEGLDEFINREQPFVKLKNDSRVFPFGSILRKSSFDELPQLFNILNGDMSLVGPRPLVFSEIAECNEIQKKRLLARPGLTGWAQINGRTDVDFARLMDMDLYYLKNRGLRLDVEIMVKTIYVVISRRGAY